MAKKNANEEAIMAKLVAIHEAASEDDRSEVPERGRSDRRRISALSRIGPVAERRQQVAKFEGEG
jgi:hypothetical protein